MQGNATFTCWKCKKSLSRRGGTPPSHTLPPLGRIAPSDDGASRRRIFLYTDFLFSKVGRYDLVQLELLLKYFVFLLLVEVLNYSEHAYSQNQCVIYMPNVKTILHGTWLPGDRSCDKTTTVPLSCRMCKDFHSLQMYFDILTGWHIGWHNNWGDKLHAHLSLEVLSISYIHKNTLCNVSTPELSRDLTSFHFPYTYINPTRWLCYIMSFTFY